MKNQTQKEIQHCQQILKSDALTQHDREMAERGLNDWFFASLIEDGLLAANPHERRSRHERSKLT